MMSKTKKSHEQGLQTQMTESWLPKQSLRLLGGDRDKHLALLGLRTMRDLLDYEPLRASRTLEAVARGCLTNPQIELLVKEEFLKRESNEAIGWPVRALRNITEEESLILDGMGVKTVGDLAQLGEEADQVVLAVLEDNGFSERPSAPAQLLPRVIGSVASTTRFATFVRDVELCKLKFSVNQNCASELPISGRLTGAGKPNSLLDLLDLLKKSNTKDNKVADLLRNFFASRSTGELASRKVLAETLANIRDTDGGALSSIFETQKCPVVHLGYMCDHRQKWINLGTHLGEVVHSVSLAPGESRNIAFVNWRRRQLTALEEHTTFSEKLTATFVQNRALEEITSAVAREHQGGQTQTDANTAVTAAGLVGAAGAVGGVAGGMTGAAVGGLLGSIIPGIGTTIGATAGGIVGSAVGGLAGTAAGGLVYSANQVLGKIEADTTGDRDIVGNVQQRINLSTSQTASAVRSLWSTIVVEDTQAEGVDATTSNITNYNHMHALNIEYYEVLQHYLVRIELQGVQPILFLPFTFLDFTNFRFIRDYWDIVRLHIDDEGLRTQGDSYFVTEEKPEVPDLLPVPPVPVPPTTKQPPKLKNLKIDFLFESLPSNTDIDLVIMRGDKEIHGSEEESIIPGSYSGYGWRNRYTFGDISDAHEITGINFSRKITYAQDTKYKIQVYSGELYGDDNLLEDISGYVIAPNKNIEKDNKDVTFSVEWKPAKDFQVDNPQALEEYNMKKAEREKIIAANQRRMDAYDALARNQSFTRFRERLQRLVLRRRHFFTRVILNAIEPEEVIQLLEALNIGHIDASTPEFGIPLSSIAHTIPLGMTDGAFVLKLKKNSVQKLAQTLGVDIELEEVARLLNYFDDTLMYFDDLKKQKPWELAQADHVYVPTGGLFAEAILGRANSAEYLDLERFFNWQDSPIPHQAPTIQPVGTDSRFQKGDVSVNVPSGNLQVINPVTLPDPVGLQGVLTAIQNPNLFRDMSKAGEIAGIVGSLSSLAGQMGQAAANMTGQAAQQAIEAATQAGQAAAGLAQSMMNQAFNQAGSAFTTLTSQGAALNQAAKIEGAHSAVPLVGGGSSGGGATTPTAVTSDAGNSVTDKSGAPQSLQEETFRRIVGVDDGGSKVLRDGTLDTLDNPYSRDKLASAGTLPADVAPRKGVFLKKATKPEDKIKKILSFMADLRFSKSSDIDTAFSMLGPEGGTGYLGWLQPRLRKIGSFKKGALHIEGKTFNFQFNQMSREGFSSLWDGIPLIFGREEINVLEFLSLDLATHVEGYGDYQIVSEGEREEKTLNYFFEEIVVFNPKENKNIRVKVSYNTSKRLGNLTAHDLFSNKIFKQAHHELLPTSNVGWTPDDPSWGKEDYSETHASSSLIDDSTSYIRQADFFKFRGRGYIQTTGRANYHNLANKLKEKIELIPSPLWSLVDSWHDNIVRALTESRDEDWTSLFKNTNCVVGHLAVENFSENGCLNIGSDYQALNGSGAGTVSNLGDQINSYGPALREAVKAILIQIYDTIEGQ